MKRGNFQHSEYSSPIFYTPHNISPRCKKSYRSFTVGIIVDGFKTGRRGVEYSLPRRCPPYLTSSAVVCRHQLPLPAAIASKRRPRPHSSPTRSVVLPRRRRPPLSSTSVNVTARRPLPPPPSSSLPSSSAAVVPPPPPMHPKNDDNEDEGGRNPARRLPLQ